LASLKTLDLPDSSSSSLPADLQLPGLVSMTLFSVDNIQHLAGFAPQLHRLECFSMALAPAPKHQHHTAAAASAAATGTSAGSPAALASCRVLAAHVVTSSSAKTAVACLSAALPALQQLAALPQLQHTGSTGPEDQACDEVTLRDIQAALPGLQLAAQA
jgi:hypothetical protein